MPNPTHKLISSSAVLEAIDEWIKRQGTVQSIRHTINHMPAALVDSTPEQFARALAAAQVDTPPEVKRLIDEKFWDLVDSSGDLEFATVGKGLSEAMKAQPAPDIAALVAETETFCSNLDKADGRGTLALIERLYKALTAQAAALAEAQRMLDEAGFKICPQCGEWADDFCSNEDDAEAFCMDCHAKAPFECNQCSFRVFSPEEFEGKCGSSGCYGDLIRRVKGGAA